MLLVEPLLETIRDTLRSNLTYISAPNYSIRITNEERVPAESGEEFINVYGATSTNLIDPTFNQRKEEHSVNIGITRRLAGAPFHNSAEMIYTYDEDLISRTKSSMAKRAYEIINLIDGKYSIGASIRQLSSLSNYAFCILTPLGYAGSEPIREVGTEHFYSDNEDELDYVGLFLSLNFTGLHTFFNKG